MDDETKRTKKKIDIFIKRLIKCYNDCNKLIKSSIDRSDGHVAFSGELYVDVYFSSKKLYVATAKYSKLLKLTRKLYNELTGLLDRMEHEKLAVVNDGQKDTIIVRYNIKEYVISISKLIDNCIFEASSMFPITLRGYAIEKKHGSLNSFPITKEKLARE